MYEKLHGIVLNVIRYNDRHNIAHVYTDSRGMMSFLVAQGVTRGARLRNALFMPLSLIEMEARHMPGRDLATMRDVRRYEMLADVYADPVKNAIVLFVSELLTRVIHEQERNSALYRYVEQSVILLENLQVGVANFHICFLYHLGAHLGIQPDLATYRPGRWFDMDNGVFVDNPAALPGAGHHLLQPDEAHVIHLLSHMTFAGLHHFRFNREERNRVLDTIIAYYRLHNSTIGTLRSPEVLKQLFV
ncbi:MAG: DNA repair protein RecO C-terminal domain-containing protein [Muribaculaceae bacterium]|nr:DNA repair protein RecO C-terminal domain-containing protein [Muribaculaceae bacterium]